MQQGQRRLRVAQVPGDKTGGCYAEAIARRFAGTKAFPHGFAVTPHPERLADPFRWRAPSRVFVNSMSDLSIGLKIDSVRLGRHCRSSSPM